MYKNTVILWYFFKEEFDCLKYCASVEYNFREMLNKPHTVQKETASMSLKWLNHRQYHTGDRFQPHTPDIWSSIHIDSQYILQQHYL